MTICTITSPGDVRGILQHLGNKGTFLLHAPPDCWIWHCARALIFNGKKVTWLHAEDILPCDPISNDQFINEVVQSDLHE